MKTITTTLLLLLLASFAFATQEKKQAKIRITGPGGFLDETMIYFDLGVSPQYSATEDGPKAYSNVHDAPSIYSVSSDNVYCSTNGYSQLTTSEIIPLGIRTDTTGVHIFTATLLNHFDSTSIIELEDRQTGIFTNLRNNFYPVQLADSQVINGRFFLHVSRSIVFSSVTAGCANNDGVLQINQDNSILWTATHLYDSTGYLIDSFHNISGPYNFSNLSEGSYTLVMTRGDYVATKSLNVPGNYVVAHFQASELTAAVNQDITFTSTVHNATLFQWELGDSAQIGGIANPTYSYLQPGVYEVILNCSNAAGCQYRDSAIITISAATGVNELSEQARNIWAYSQTITVALNEEIKQGAELKIYNVLGQPVYSNPVTEQTTNVILNTQPTGYYIVSVQNDKVISTKRIFIGQ